jgi:hypothetical protein
MQTAKLLCAGRMNIPEKQHVFETILAPLLVAASGFEHFWVLEGAEKHVPKRDVREVVGVVTELMVDPMRFRPLEKKANPWRGFDVPMIKELTDCDKNRVITSGAQTCAKQWIQNQAAQDGVNQDLHRMFVKAGKDFQSPSGMMNLM